MAKFFNGNPYTTYTKSNERRFMKHLKTSSLLAVLLASAASAHADVSNYWIVAPVLQSASAPGGSGGSTPGSNTPDPDPTPIPEPEPTPAPAPILVGGGTLDFGTFYTGSAVSRTATLANTGNAPAPLTISGAPADIVKSGTCGAELAGGESCSLTLTWTPTSAYTLSTSVSVGTVTYTLAGIAQAPLPRFTSQNFPYTWASDDYFGNWAYVTNGTGTTIKIVSGLSGGKADPEFTNRYWAPGEGFGVEQYGVAVIELLLENGQTVRFSTNSYTTYVLN